MKIRTSKDRDFLSSGNEMTCTLKKLVVDILELYKTSTTHKNWNYSIKEWDNEAAPGIHYTVIIDLGSELAMAINAWYCSPTTDITEHGEEQRKVWEFILHEIGLGGIDSLYGEARKRNINQHDNFMFNVNQRAERQITPVDPTSLKVGQQIRFLDNLYTEGIGFIMSKEKIKLGVVEVSANGSRNGTWILVQVNRIIEIVPENHPTEENKGNSASELRDELAKRKYTIEDFEEGDHVV